MAFSDSDSDGLLPPLQLLLLFLDFGDSDCDDSDCDGSGCNDLDSTAEQFVMNSKLALNIILYNSAEKTTTDDR